MKKYSRYIINIILLLYLINFTKKFISVIMSVIDFVVHMYITDFKF